MQEGQPSSNIPTVPPPPPREGAASGPAGRRRRSPWLLAGVLVAIAAIAAVTVLLLTGGDDEPAAGEPHVVTTGELSSFAKGAGRPVYWAGAPAAGFKLELTEAKGDQVYVRYLSNDAKAGDPRAAFTTIATYPVQGAYDKLGDSADNPGAVDGKGASGARTLYYKKAPSNVYVALPGSDYLIEVFATEPSAALQIASSQSLVQVP